MEPLVFWVAMLAAYLLMKRAGCFSQPVLYPDFDHPFRYWWAQRLGRSRHRRLCRTAGNKNPESLTLSGFVRVGDALEFCGAEERNRTPDLLITNELLYRLSYFGNMFR